MTDEIQAPPLETSRHADVFAEAQRVFRGRFTLERLVAASPIRGLFVAFDDILKRRVGLRIHYEPSGRSRTWHERETELLASLDHPSIRAVYAAGYDGDWAYRVIKWIEGESLHDAVARGRRTIPEVLRLARDLTGVLEYAHARYVVLRRIAPGNVMQDRAGNAIITDLRWANRCLPFADPDPEAGVQSFLAPETWHGHAGEPASDIYALAAILYYALTGAPPAVNPSLIVKPSALRPNTPQVLDAVIMRALNADPRERYLNAGELMSELISVLGEFDAPPGEPMAEASQDTPQAWEKRLRRSLGDEYELLDELGSGGFGNVYRVRDLRLERDVALKVLHPQFTADPANIERFRKEARLAARLDHPNIVDIYGIGNRAGIVWYTMAYVQGVSLAKLVQVEGPLPISRVLAVMDEALSALELAHAQGVVHRDLKPENILVDATTQNIQITDFGLAIALQTDGFGGASSHSGTPEFASPEQLLGEKVDLRSDIYSLTSVAYFALLGEPPYGSGPPEAILARQTTGALPDLPADRPEIPVDLARVLAKGAARTPEERYASAREYRNALRLAARVVQTPAGGWFRSLFRS